MDYFVFYLLGVIAVMIFMKHGDMTVAKEGGKAFNTPLFIVLGLLSWVTALGFSILLIITKEEK